MKRELIKGRYYLELSSQLNNLEADFYLGFIYSNRKDFNEDINKAIKYYSKCIENKKIFVKDLNSLIIEDENNYYYRSYNDLGLLKIVYFNDIEKATECIKESAFSEFPFGQNNFGLLCQFYFDQKDNAKYMFKKASKNSFALADYNLGYLLEQEGKNKEAIEHYIRASDNEDKPLVFHNVIHFDLKLEVSKKFIITLTNLKLVFHFINDNDIENARKFFVRAISRLSYIKDMNFSHPFRFVFNDNFRNILVDLKKFIFQYPLFNLSNQPDFSLKLVFLDDFKNNNKIQNEMIFEDPGKLFDFVIKDPTLSKNFIIDITSIIDTMKQILYLKPYPILFGRIHLSTIDQNAKKISKDINNDFYNGFYN